MIRREASDRIQARLLTAFCVLSVAGLLLAFAGWFAPVPCVLAAALAGAAAVFLPCNQGAATRTTEPPPVWRWTRLGLVVAGAVLFLRPGAPMMGNWDPGVYLAQGHALAAQGTYLFEDSAAALLTGDEVEALYPEGHGNRIKYPGFYVDPARPQRLAPQFFPLFPVWIGYAALTRVPGLPFLLPGLFALGSLLLLLRLAEEVGGPWAAAAAGLLFLLNPIQIWFSGFPTAEVLMQFVFLAAAFSYLLWLRLGGRSLAILAGACTALLLFVSVTGLALAALMTGAHVLLAPRRPGRWPALAPVAALIPLSLIQNLFFTRQYFAFAADYLPAIRFLLVRPILVLPAIVLLLLLVAWRVPWPDRLKNRAARTAPWLLAGAWALTCAVLAWRLAGDDPLDERLRTLAAMTSRSNLLIAVTGLFLLAWKRPRLALALLLVGGVFTYLFYSSRMMVRLYPWAYKRYLPVTLPLLCLCAGVCWGRLLEATRHRALRITLLAALLFLAVRPLYRGRAFAFVRETPGMQAFLAAAASEVPADAVVLAPKWIATPLDFVHGRCVIPLYEEGIAGDPAARYARIIQRLRAEGQPVYAVGQAAELALLPASAVPARGIVLETVQLEQSREPFGARSRDRRFEVYIRAIE